MSSLHSTTRRVLLASGWRELGNNLAIVSSWEAELRRSDQLEMFSPARVALLRYGGVEVDARGPGENLAREPFRLIPTLLAYEGDRLKEASGELGTALYPLGEAGGGHYFLVIGLDSRVYGLMHGHWVIGHDIEEALNNLVLGRRAAAR